jgi:ABC-2 type transport system ATP-binding protein
MSSLIRRSIAIILASFLLALTPSVFAGRIQAAPSDQADYVASYEVRQYDELWAMEDGVKLPVSVFVPVSENDELFPVLIIAHPFNFDKKAYELTIAEYASRGYVGVTYNCRGWSDAEGEIQVIDPDFDIKDLSNIITMVSEDIRFPVLEDELGPIVGVMGYSMGGNTSYLIAPRSNPRPGDPGDPRVRAVVPMHGGSDLLFTLFPNGALKWFWATAILLGCSTAGLTGALFRTAFTMLDPKLNVWERLISPIRIMSDFQPFSDVTPDLLLAYTTVIERRTEDYEATKDIVRKRSARYWCDEEMDGNVEHPITAAILMIAGWNDDLYYPNEALRVFNTMTSGPRRVVIDNAGHGGGWQPLDHIPNNEEKLWVAEQVMMWFDHYLKGIDNGADRGPAIYYYRDWEGNSYAGTDSWPPVGTRDVTYYTEGGARSRQGTLSTTITASTPPDMLVNIGFGGSISLPHLNDLTGVVGLPDLPLPEKIDLFEMPFLIYSYVSEPLICDTVIAGTPRLTLAYMSSNQFTQLTPKLYEVAPDGTQTLVSRGWYEGYDEKTWTRIETPDKQVEMAACSHLAKAGSRLKLEFSTSDMLMSWPLFGISFIYIMHDGARPTSITMPIAPN